MFAARRGHKWASDYAEMIGADSAFRVSERRGVSSTTVAIELLSDRMDIAVMKAGRVVACKRVPLELSFDATAWAKGVKTSGEALKEAVTELGCAGARAILTYRSPTQAVDMASFQLRSTS